MNLPSIESYGRYSSDNYGVNALVVSMMGVDVYFSYKTPVAFRASGVGLVVSENCWGRTTGKHLNWIDGGSTAARDKRVSRDEFERLYAEHVAGTAAAA